jgi:cell division GTPase FtsZ
MGELYRGRRYQIARPAPARPATPDKEISKVDSGIPKVSELELGAPGDGAEADAVPGALRLALVGVGQCGNNLADTAWEAGLRRVGAINSNQRDMARIRVPRQLRLGDEDSGAGKDTKVGRALAERQRKDIVDFLRGVCGRRYDRLLIACGAGGGTGAGAFPVMLECAEAAAPVPRTGDGPTVGAILALPGSGGGYQARANTLEVLEHALAAARERRLSPLVLIDNARMQHLASVLDFYPTVNRHVINQLIRFNAVAAHDSGVAQFDGRDFASILDSGVVTFGITRVANPGEDGAIGKAIRDNFLQNVLLDLNLAEMTHAGAVFVASTAVFSGIVQKSLEEGLGSLNRLIAVRSVLHHGIYVDESASGLTVTTILGGLSEPAEYLARLRGEIGR